MAKAVYKYRLPTFPWARPIQMVLRRMRGGVECNRVYGYYAHGCCKAAFFGRFGWCVGNNSPGRLQLVPAVPTSQ